MKVHLCLSQTFFDFYFAFLSVRVYFFFLNHCTTIKSAGTFFELQKKKVDFCEHSFSIHFENKFFLNFEEYEFKNFFFFFELAEFLFFVSNRKKNTREENSQQK